jgi:hypothetical protein
MITINDIIDEMIVNEVRIELGFCPDPARVEPCIRSAREKIAARVICLLDNDAWKDVATNYVFPANKNPWMTRESLPESGRVLTYSPLYAKDDPMRWRIMDAQFVRLCREVELWADLEAALP